MILFTFKLIVQKSVDTYTDLKARDHDSNEGDMILGLHAIPELVSKESRRVANRHNWGGTKPAEGMYGCIIELSTTNCQLLSPIPRLPNAHISVCGRRDEANTHFTCKHYRLD